MKGHDGEQIGTEFNEELLSSSISVASLFAEIMNNSIRISIKECKHQSAAARICLS